MQETILILDFGSQYTQLIARRVRELNVYCEIHPFNNLPTLTQDIKGVILSGSPYSTLQEDAPQFDLTDIKGKLPLLGVCYGAQYMALVGGGQVAPSEIREYGRANLSEVDATSDLFQGVGAGSQVWMSHGDKVTQIPPGFVVGGRSDNTDIAFMLDEQRRYYGVQFHPEFQSKPNQAHPLFASFIEATLTKKLESTSKQPADSN